jgi:hypothetical protein
MKRLKNYTLNAVISLALLAAGVLVIAGLDTLADTANRVFSLILGLGGMAAVAKLNGGSGRHKAAK